MIWDAAVPTNHKAVQKKSKSLSARSLLVKTNGSSIICKIKKKC